MCFVVFILQRQLPWECNSMGDVKKLKYTKEQKTTTPEVPTRQLFTLADRKSMFSAGNSSSW